MNGTPKSVLRKHPHVRRCAIVHRARWSRARAVMKKLLALTALLSGICTGTLTQAQTKSDTFTFGSAGVIGTTQSSNCSPITAWDNVVDAYPQDMGEVCFNFYPDGFSGMEIPFQLGYPNNGFLLDNTPFTWGPMVSTSTNTYTQAGTAAYTGYGAGVVVNVNINVVVTYVRSCGHGICHYFPVHTLTGGTGGVTFNPICGNGIVESGERCDDGAGNGTASSCCTATCTIQPAGTPCTGGTCNGTDTCVPGATTTTTSVSSTSTTFSTTSTTLPPCGPTPMSGCQGAEAQKASLALGNGKLSWKWTSSAAVATTDFGDPSTTTNYLLCIYDASGEKLGAEAPAGPCGGTKPCWKVLGTVGFKYANTAGPDGLTKVLLKAGSVGKGKLGVNGSGPNLHLPALLLTLPVTVQLQQDASSVCWEATYGTATTNTASAFKAKSD